MTSLKTSIKTITYLSDIGCLEIQGASLGGQAFVRGIGQEGNIRITWIEEGKPVSCFAHYQQNTTSEKIAQSIILNGLRCQIQ